MPLTSGTKLGPYEIQSPLGAGGMGEVYRAVDTRLDRTVAVKILPDHLAQDIAAKLRFEREARAISSLNHPNICTLHDVGSENGTSYLVMEFVQGETLEARLQKGPLPLKQALETGKQICDALDKAHRAGIIHRDLKPGNIMLTGSGAKLLDFGLSKPAGMLGSLGNTGPVTPSTPTMNLTALTGGPGTLTQQGMIVGTFQYMAPEVLQGQEADARSDIFSFGAVLYEMVAGRRAFQGKSQISVASAILEKDPESLLQILPMAPAALDPVVQGCLAKDPESRWQSASDVGRQLRWIATSGSSATMAPVPKQSRRMWERFAWGAAILIVLAAVLWSVLRETKLAPTIRSYLPPPAEAGFDFVGDFSGPPAISPDGLSIAFCARKKSERNMVWIQSLSDLTAKKLEGTEGASFPFWSGDGKFLGFFANGHLKKVSVGGGPVITLADAPNARGGTWNQDNVIIFEPDYRDSLWRISAAGGTPVRLTKLDSAKHTTQRWPQFLPDGKHFLFFATNHSGGTEQGIYMGSLDSDSYKHVVEADSQAQYAAGYLLYHIQSQLVAQKFDVSSGTVLSDPVPLATFVEYDAGTWHNTFVANANGVLLYEPGSKSGGTGLAWIDRSGKVLGKVAESANYKGSGQFSPDGKRLAVSVGDPEADIWVYDLTREARTRLTFGGGTHLAPSWSPDGQRVIYVKLSGVTLLTGTSLRARMANGGGQEEVLMEGDPSGTSSRTLLQPQWSPDNRYLLYTGQSGPSAGIWAVPTSGEKKQIPIILPQTPQTRIIQFRLSPDGRWLAYSSTESGREEVYVTHFPDGSGRWQVSQTGATFPSWRRDSREIYFIGLDGNFQVASVNPTAAEFELKQVHVLFPTGSYTSPLGVPYDVAPDGQRFIFATLPESAPTPLVLVTNWMGDLKK